MKRHKLLLVFLSIFALTVSTASCADNKETTVDFFERNVINLYENEFYRIDADWSNYSLEAENTDVIRIDQAARKIYGLQKGTSNLIIKAENGSYDECTVNVISKTQIQSIENLYSIDENEMNFITLYVAENENGIVRYLYDSHECNESQLSPVFLETLLYTKEGVWSCDTNSYEIISMVQNTNVTPNDLTYGDIIICHYDYKGSETYLGLSQRNVYNLYYTGLKNTDLPL